MFDGINVFDPRVGIPLWAAVYSSDYLLTLLCARIYARGAEKHVAYDTGVEVIPFLRKDEAERRRSMARFVRQLVLSCLVLWVFWWAGNRMDPRHQLAWLFREIFPFCLGAFLLLEVPIHIGHASQITLFHFASRSLGVSGQLRYAVWVTLGISAARFGAFSLACLALYLGSGSSFFLGGFYKCFASGLKQWRLATRECRSQAARQNV